MNKRKYFGTDGIRGRVGKAPLTPDFVLKLAHAVGSLLSESSENPAVAIGKDTRISGYMLESALVAGFNSAGVDVILLGPVPTPAVAYLTRTFRISLGVVISASHNPFYDNGIKFFGPGGGKLTDQWEVEVERRLAEAPNWVESEKLGKTVRSNSANGRYIEFCKSTFANDLSLKGLHIVIDAAHGAAYKVAPKVLFELGAQVVEVANQPNGFNINAGVGATHMEYLVKMMQQHQADIGIALDGDADRLQMVDAKGRIFGGDELLYLMAVDAQENAEEVKGVVGTLMTNMAIEVALKQRGIDFVRANVGDRYILQELKARGWFLGGENSGHLLDLRKHSTGDALISALHVLQACVRSGKTLAENLAQLELYPQCMINVHLTAAGYAWLQDAELQQAQQQLQQQLGDQGRILIRASGTEPLIRVMVECKQQELAQTTAQQLAQIIENNQ